MVAAPARVVKPKKESVLPVRRVLANSATPAGGPPLHSADGLAVMMRGKQERRPAGGKNQLAGIGAVPLGKCPPAESGRLVNLPTMT